MKKLSLFTRFTVLIALVLQIPFAAMAQSGFTLTPVLTASDVRPDGKPYIGSGNIWLADFRAINNRGDVLIGLQTSAPCPSQLLLVSGETRSLIALGCAPSGSSRFDSINEASVNDQGQVVFSATSSENGESRTAVYLYENGQTTLIAKSGDNTPSGNRFNNTLFDLRIGNQGDVVFKGHSLDAQGQEGADIFLYSKGQLRSLVTDGAPSPIGGTFNFLRLIPVPQINAAGDVLFFSGVKSAPEPGTGLFVATKEGIRQTITTADLLSIGRQGSQILGTFNDQGEIAFSVNAGAVSTEQEGAIHLYSKGQIKRIVKVGDPSPLGGAIAPFTKTTYFFPGPLINNRGAVTFQAAVGEGSSRLAIFLASEKAMVKVVAVGDQLNDQKIGNISFYAVNDRAEVAFIAFGKGGKHLGVFKAAPVEPVIEQVKIKRKHGKLNLLVTGTGFITNDALIEVNGLPLEATLYPVDSQEDGGTTRQLRSSDPRLNQILASEKEISITVYNSLTNLRSAGKVYLP